MSTYKLFLKNNLLVISASVVVYAQGIVIMPLIIKTAGVETYGGYVLLVSILSFVFGISSFGVGFQRSRFLPSASDRQTRSLLFYPQFYFQFASLIVFSVLMILFYQYFDKIFLKEKITFSIWLIVPYFICYFFYTQTTDFYRYTHKMNYLTYASIIHHSLFISIIILSLLWLSLSINILIVAKIIASLLVALPLSIMIYKEIGILFTVSNLKNIVNDVKLGFPLVLVYVTDVMLSISDRYVIGALMSVIAVGYYSPSYTLGTLIVFFPKVSGVVLQPMLSKSVDLGDLSEAQTMVNYTIKVYLLLAIPFIIGSGLLSKPLLILFANSEVAHHASLVTPVVALGTLFYGLSIILSNILFVQMRTRLIFKLNFIASVLNISLNLILFPIFNNIIVAAITTLICYFVVFLCYARALSSWPIDYLPGAIWKPLLASSFMATGLYLASLHFGDNNHQALYLLGEILAAIIIYCLILIGLKTFSQKELLFLKKAFS